MDAGRVALALGLVLAAAGAARAQETTRVSVDSSGVQGNGISEAASISADGNTVVFDSPATNLVPGDTNGFFDVFVHDRTTGVTELVSVDSNGTQGNAGSSATSGGAISSEGQIVVFASSASNLVVGDTNGFPDIFLHDRTTGVTERISVDSSGLEGNDWSQLADMTPDGQIVAFTSNASNLAPGDTNGTWDVFVHDRSRGTTERISVDSLGGASNGVSDEASISADGQIVAFYSEASNLVAGDTNKMPDVFVHDRSTGITERISVSSSGSQGDQFSGDPSISADGHFVAFESNSTNLVVGDTNGIYDVFVHDRTTGNTERVSVDSSGNQGQGGSGSFWPSISADGGVVAFGSHCTNLVANDDNQKTDAFRHDRSTGVTERVSVSTMGMESDGESGFYMPPMSSDGQVIAFTSSGTDLVDGDTNGTYDAFVRDLRPAPPVVTSVTPTRSPYKTSMDVTLDGFHFLDGTNSQVFFGSAPATNLVVVDNSTITCTAPQGSPGPATITVQDSIGTGSLDGAFTYTPAVLWDGDPSPGGKVSIHYLCSPFDGVFAIAGASAVNVPTPPFDGALGIFPFEILFVMPPGVWPFDHLDLNGTVPNDPSLIGVTLLLQALDGPSFSAPKNATWTNVAAMTIQ